MNFTYESPDDHLKEQSGSQSHIWELRFHLFKAWCLLSQHLAEHGIDT